MEIKRIESSELIAPLESGVMVPKGDVVHIFTVRRSDKIDSILEEGTFAYEDRVYTVKSVNVRPASEGDIITLNGQY